MRQAARDVGQELQRVIDQAAKLARQAGEDLSRLFDGKQPYDERKYFTACYARYLICGDGRWVLIAHSDETRTRRTRLFDTRSDPGEVTNLADQFPEKVAELRGVLEQEAGGTLPQFGDEAVMGG